MCVCVCEYYCQPCAHTSTVHTYTNGRALGHFNVGKFQCLWHTKSTLNIDRNSRAREREKVNQCSMLECMLYVVVTQSHAYTRYPSTNEHKMRPRMILVSEWMCSLLLCPSISFIFFTVLWFFIPSNSSFSFREANSIFAQAKLIQMRQKQFTHSHTPRR